MLIAVIKSLLITLYLISDYRHSSADKPHLNMPWKLAQERAPVVDLTPINPSLRKYNTAHLRGRHGFLDYQNPPPERAQPMFWTLPKRSNPETNLPRSKTYDEHSTDYFAPKPTIVQDRSREPPATTSRENGNNDSIRISPIDPRSTGAFKSSTPSNKENVIDITVPKLLSPVKSTMTNEELYAVIHKSKKKLNIRDNPDRAASPALSTISLSPVNSETSLQGKGNQKYPETGYLGDPRSRNSWSSMDRPGLPAQAQPAANRFQKSETTCADRFGPVPQTSRLDFKKLLLQHSVKLNTLAPQTKSNKLSAVEQLKLTREKAPLQQAPSNRSQINILDLSGSPKTYTHRKVMKPVPQPASPGRTNALIKEHKSSPKILLSPKSQWRFSSPRSDVLSSPIPEANNEDDTSNSSGEKHDVTPPAKTVAINTKQHFGARRNLIPINENLFERDTDSPESLDQGVFPLSTECSKTQGLSRSEVLQARRAEFFNSPPESSPPKLSSFRRPDSGSPSSKTNKSPDRQIPSPSTLETAL